ncbi:MAG: SRPBCC family protein [Bacteroidota bacterium]
MRFFILLISLFLTITLHAQPNQPTVKHFWHTVETKSKPEAVWAIWIDVANWHKWDTGLKAAEMTNNFALDQKGIITSLEGRKSKFKIVYIEEGRSYTFKTNLPLGALYVKRYLEEKEGKTQFTHEVWFKGITSGIFARQFGGKFKEMLPGVMNNIKEIVESK